MLKNIPNNIRLELYLLKNICQRSGVWKTLNVYECETNIFKIKRSGHFMYYI